MRILTAAALLIVTTAPAFAGLGDAGDSTSQTNEYGRFFGYILGVAAAGLLIFGVYHVIKGMIAESQRGKTFKPVTETILDDVPRKKPELYLGEKVPEWKTVNRETATKAALRYLSRTDEELSLKHLTGVAEKAIGHIKAALEERSPKRIERRVTAECLAELQTEIKRLRKKGERHVYGQVEVLEIQIVHIEAPANKAKHKFTALVTVKSKDFIEDDETGEVLKGNKKTYGYQEFLTFHRTQERWLVERLRPAGDMDRILNEKNVLAQRELDAFSKKAEPKMLQEFEAK